MRETITIENSEGRLRLKSNKEDSILYLDNNPIQFTWIRDWGTTLRYQIAKPATEDDFIKDEKFRNFVKNGSILSDSLSHQFDYILKQLYSGKYELSIEIIDPNVNLVEFTTDVYEFQFQTMWDGDGQDDLIETQILYDERIIEDYIDLIKTGCSPIMVILTANNSENKFIIDGHHKFIAYSRLMKPVKALLIRHLNAEHIDRLNARDIFESYDYTENDCRINQDEKYEVVKTNYFRLYS